MLILARHLTIAERRFLALTLLLFGGIFVAFAGERRWHVGNVAIDRTPFFVVAFPNEELDVRVERSDADHDDWFVVWRGQRVPLDNGRKAIHAGPQIGESPLQLWHAKQLVGEVVVFVQVPLSEIRNGELLGFDVGEYPASSKRDQAIYQPPAGFIRVTSANQNIRISPHYRLGEFVSKQRGGFPKYLALKPELLIKLEQIGDEIRKQGVAFRKFHVMSGYRTPSYNRAIGNVEFSRHLWGGAADIYVDESPRDGWMDDLNGDGLVDREDARWLWNVINRMSTEGMFGDRVGGLAVYDETEFHGPFVHVDVRGHRARW